jgi:hypothetical protein
MEKEQSSSSLVQELDDIGPQILVLDWEVI